MTTISSRIGGARHGGGAARDVVNPHGNAVLARCEEATPEQIELALATAAEGAKTMAAMPAHARAELLRRASALLEQRKESVARTITLESGKPIRDARTEVERCIVTLRTSGEEALRIGGEVMPLDITKPGEGRIAVTRRFPVGVVTAISPFNFPLNLPAHKVGPGLAAGNAMILKPAPRTPLTADALVELLLEAGAPPAAISLVFGSPPAIEPLITDPRVAMVSFTGSAAVGWDIRRQANKKKTTLELGGNAAAIVCEDADLDLAAARCVAGSFTFAGQVCIRSQRLLVHESLASEFTKRFVAAAAALRRGDPLDEATQLGPMIDEASAQRAYSWVSEARERGAELLLGGPPEGAFLPPTILARAPLDCRAYAEEIFAPVVTLESFDALEDALARANESRYGLQAGIFTSRIEALMLAFDRLRVGGVIHNDAPMFRSDAMPYGGIKDSGFGREGVRFAVEDMTELRLLVLRRDA
jgi:glyceraldehyde-3-phosphate dehydrogenase (NADP+)